eukprot:TRINITY_DN22256_c0_g1_i1.p1 TRINITY_DN22256_c0_g1~~TRINITY_DN22256_c0_g1_i1.p1  ORF type:complete len:1137 (-),score=158.10 TRINITY_DN22256_c0_g1_i1:10-3420(-)
MADWTYEMLRYAFSWNEESADKAMKYVVTSRSDYESLSEFQLLDILLLTILTEKDEVERTSALVFLEEHGTSLVFDYTRLHKVYFVLDNILGSPVDGQSMTYALKSQTLVTYTALLIQFSCFETDAARFEGFVDLLYSIIKHTNKSVDRILRAYACECLQELESWYPGLLFPLLGEDWSVPPGVLPSMEGCQQDVGHHTLGKFVNDEMLHIHDSYSRLFFTTFQHFTEQVVQEALKRQPLGGSTNVDDGESTVDALSVAGSMAATPMSSRPGTPPDTPRGRDAGPHLGVGQLGAVPAAASVSSGETFRFQIPMNCRRGPEVSFNLGPDQTPPRLPRKLVRTLTRSISLVLEAMPTSSSWTKIFFAERLSLFIRVLALPCRVIFHHFSPLLHASRPLLLHAFLVVTTLFSKEIDASVSEAVVDRLFALMQDTATEPCFRLLAINWLIALSARETSSHVFDLLWLRVEELCPRWHDPLELKETKLQALLYCCQRSGKLPKNLLVVCESMSEFMYCCRPVGAHAVVFRFLLRVVINFAQEMDRLEVPQTLCDLLRSHPRLLPSVLSLARRSNSEAVQYQLLRSLGDFVARLEPPSRIQCYFGLLVTLSETSWLDPSYVMCALRRLVFCRSSTLTWNVGMRVLITCRRVILSHPQAVIYQPMQRLLHHLANFQGNVDLRDRALLYLRLLTHAGSASLGTLFHPNPGDVEEMTQMLTPVLPKTIRLVSGPVPFLKFFKSIDERRKLGILDGQCAVLVLPSSSNPAQAAVVDKSIIGTGFDATDWKVRWGDSSDDHQFPEAWLRYASGPLQSMPSNAGWKNSCVVVLSSYRAHVQACPPGIRLPFVLEYRKGPCEGLEGWLSCPRQLFSLELTFTKSEHFVPITPIRIPFIAEEAPAPLPVGTASKLLHTSSTAMDGASSGCAPGTRATNGFPCSNKLLLKLQPISPVPTSFGVNITFNDLNGHMYFGQLETFTVAFQDLFLPVRMPLALWSDLFESLWNEQGALSEHCWSVKVLDMERCSVTQLIRSQLGPFVVPEEVELEEEDFDFQQEEHFERWSGTEDKDAAGDDKESDDASGVDEIELDVETSYVMIFIPPCHHLLMRFAISSHSTIVRIKTDRFQLLSYMDAFFLSWSRPTHVTEC